MSERTKIEWCDHTWSPWRGCTKVSAGCANCYAEKLSKRNPAVLGQWGNGKPRVLSKNWNDPALWQQKSEREIQSPYDPRPRVFPSLCDWLDDEVPIEWLARFLTLIQDTPNLDWLLLTKRPELWEQRMRLAHSPEIFDAHDLMVSDWLHGKAPSNVWIGTSVEDQANADRRIQQLLKIPAKVRFLSVEPMLGRVQMTFRCPLDHNGDGDCHVHPTGCPRIDWVIVGGESGPGARPCKVDWIRDVVRQCANASVPCFVKQLGAVVIEPNCMCYGNLDGGPNCKLCGCRRFLAHPKGGDPAEWPDDLRVRQFPEVNP